MLHDCCCPQVVVTHWGFANNNAVEVRRLNKIKKVRFDYELKNQIEVDRNSPNSNDIIRESANWFADGRGRCRQRAVTLKDKEEGEIEFTSKICRKNQN